VYALQKHHDLWISPSGKKALAFAREHLPELIILDAASMRTPGIRIGNNLKSALPHIPLIHIHPGPKSRDASTADAILYEPVSVRRLSNQINRLLDLTSDNIVTAGPFSLNVAQRILITHGQEVELTPKVARLVELFLRNPGKIMDRKMLMKQVWDTEYLGDTRTLDVHIRWVREALEEFPGKPRHLKTVRGIGYRLELPTLNGME